MRAEWGLRLAALAAVLAAGAIVVVGPDAGAPCRTSTGACAQAGLPSCSRRLGPWQVARSNASGLPPARSNSACVLAPRAARAAAAPVVAIVPQASGVSGDTLLSRTAATRRDGAHASVTLTPLGSVPDHWAFAVAGSFLDLGARTSCTGLHVQPPVNAGYALIGGNWRARPHGFYFERLADACVFDGTGRECGGDPAWIPHEFAAGETFALDLALRRESSSWWLEATVVLLAETGGRRELGRMRQAVPEPCWLGAGEPGRALVLVIPDLSSAVADARVEVFDFAWRQ